jgi:hypothetical protein
MFAITKKVRAAIISMGAIGVVGAVLASGGVASAATAVHIPSPGTVTRVVTQPTTAALEAGSAGIPGFDDERCQGLADDWKKFMSAENDALNSGDDKDAASFERMQNATWELMHENCLVVY